MANDARPNQLWINRSDGRFSDEAFFSGPRAEYTIVPLDATVTRVSDTVAGRDGEDDVRQITRLHFSDMIIDL